MPGFVEHLPNALTVARLCALPVIVVVYGADAPEASWTAAVIVLVAALTDVADGFIARRFGAQSEFGRWVDPIVDRLFFFTIVAMLWYHGTLPAWATLPLLVRDGVILVLAVPMRRFTQERPQISRWGRLANFILVCALLLFIIDVRTLGWSFFAAGGALYVGTGVLYATRAVAWFLRSRALRL